MLQGPICLDSIWCRLFAKLGDVGSRADFLSNWPDLTTLVLLTSIQWEGSLKKGSQGDIFGGDTKPIVHLLLLFKALYR